MNKKLTAIFILSIIILGFESCYYDKDETLYPGSCIVAGSIPGPLYTNVKVILNSRCSGSTCHTNGGNGGSYNFDSDCSIVSHWSAINDASVINDRMPYNKTGVNLTSNEKQAITAWITAGHLYTN